jgi:predicted secreted protein
MKKLVLGIACIASMLIPLAAVQPAAAATTAIPDCPSTITNADNGATITMMQGACATLQLDPELSWSTPQSDSSAVSVFDTESFAPDQQWGLRADHSGDATITATGHPVCDPGRPCPMYVVTFSVHIHVVGPYDR